MTSGRPRRQPRRPPTRKDFQKAMKRGMANMAERITTNVFFVFALVVVVSGILMWPRKPDMPPEAKLLPGIFIAIGLFAAWFSRNWGKE